MNASLTILEMAVLVLGLGVLLLDLWTPPSQKRLLGYGAALGLILIFAYSFTFDGVAPQYAFGKTYVLDGLSLFFKRFFLIAAVIVLIMAVAYAERIETGIAEFYSLVVFALLGMMFAASANDFTMLFVSVELITVTFYVLTSFERSRSPSLEAGIKYLILGALSSAFLVYGIALVYGASNTMSFGELSTQGAGLAGKPIFRLGLLLVVLGLAFKIAAFPLQMWAPDVYQGSPAPATAFLAVGSKAAGFVLLLRLLLSAVPHEITAQLAKLLMVMSGATILYGSLCAIPQRNFKRLLGVAALSQAGSMAILYYLGGYLFAVLAAFTVVCVVMRQVDGEEISALAGLNQRSPLLAATLTLAMVSLAGVPPLAGFFGKFLLLKAAVQAGPAYYWLVAVAIAGIVISIWYYFGVIRAIYWSQAPADLSPIIVPHPLKIPLGACIGGMLYLGLFPNSVVKIADQAVKVFK